MRSAEISYWTLQVWRAAKAGHLPEDGRVELKSQLPEPVKAARRIAGHANAAAADEILWIIGLKEDGSVAPVPEKEDRDSWWRQVEAEFDGVAPSIQDHNVPTEDGLLVAFLFDVRAIPFVVRNPRALEEGVPFEVPWRAATGVRTARRSNLIELLVPTVAIPDFELIAGSESVAIEHASGMGMGAISFETYVTPKTADVVSVPYHRFTGTIRFGEIEIPLPRLQIFVDRHSPKLISTADELHISGSGKAKVRLAFACEWPPPAVKTVAVHLALPIANGRRAAILDFVVRELPTGSPSRFNWIADFIASGRRS